MVGNMKKIKQGRKKTKEKGEALVMAVRTVLKQPEKNAQRTPVKKDGLAVTVEGGAPQLGSPSGI